MRTRLLALAFAITTAAPLAAQGWMADMHRDVNDAQKKMVDLAKAIPEGAYDWRPSQGTRSVRETLLHVASDNYLIPIMMGKPAPASTGITTDFSTVTKYEKRSIPKAQIVAELEASFVHLHQAMGLTTDANASEVIDFFGQKYARSRAMVGTVTHLHEHIGKLIAYARSNNVTPPWSKQ
jgi:uncharacterized damage-inducible protein DinB